MHLKASKKEKEVATLFSGLQSTGRTAHFDGGGARTHDGRNRWTERNERTTRESIELRYLTIGEYRIQGRSMKEEKHKSF